MSQQNEDKSMNQTADPELDKLLNSALADFDTLSEDIVKKENVVVTETPKADEKSAEITTDESWTQDFIKQTAEQFGENLQILMENGDNSELGSSLQKMAQTVATAISSGSEAVNSGEGAEFQAAIAKALKDISVTSENLQNAGSGINEADLAAMFGSVSLGESGGDMLPFMQGMMQSLLSKEILYPALKELADKYPSWLNEKKDTFSAEDIEKYNKQLDLMHKVCDELETEKDDDADDVKKKRFDKIMKLMHEIQSYGAPPEDLVGDQTGLFQMDNEGNPMLPPGIDPQNCNIM
ncbi:hypothetical protein PV327_004974 [Microctonus hyperodae]|uniref:Peroxin-19 n=1 Tax=Microctonus hyperodae TaxID=165561 RepID=A0AA39FDX8_MICHY|nr:hypothetical protein PV327_004974 [Microctonus hyperodae]